MDLDSIISGQLDWIWVWLFCFELVRNFEFSFGTADYCI